MGIETHGTNGVNGEDGRSVEEAMSRPFPPGIPCHGCFEGLGGTVYRVSFIGEPDVVSTLLCGACFVAFRPSAYVYAKRIEASRG